MKIFYKHIFLSFFTAVSLFAQSSVLQNIHIHGNQKISNQKIISSLAVEKGRILPDEWPEKSLGSLIRLYHGEGYYLFRIDSVFNQYSMDSSRVQVQLYLNEGERLRLSRLNLNMKNPILSAQLKSLMILRTGDYFDEYLLQNDMDAMLGFLSNRGYPLSEIFIDTLQIHKSSQQMSLHLSLRVETGSRIFLKDIRIEGNQYTQEKYILRELRLRSGALFNQKEIDDAADHLKRLSVFKNVESPVIRFENKKAEILYRIEEGNASLIDGVLGYIPPKGTQKEGTITGRLQFEFRNLLGTGRYLEVYWEKKDRYSQAMRFGYTEPWILGHPFEAGFQFEQEIRDTTYLERSWRIPVAWKPRNTIRVSIEGGQRDILPDSMGSLVYNVPRTSAWFFSLRAEYTTFDNLLNPAEGVHYHTLFTLGSKRNIGPDYLLEAESLKNRAETRRIEIDAEAVLPVFDRQVVYAGLHGVEVKTGDDRIALSDQVRLGGTKTLRGYEEDFFRGTLVAWMNLEYRYFIGRQSRVFIFIDTGYYQRKEIADLLIRNTKIGYGFGIRLQTRLGILGIDYGLGEEDSPLQGKIHVGLTNRF